jgi:structural maintenance of chromosome 4
MEEKKVQMDEFKKQLDEKSETINKLRQAEVDLNNQLDNYKRSLVDNQKKASYWESQIETLEIQRIDEEPEEELQLQVYTPEQLKELAPSKDAIKMEIAEIEGKHTILLLYN